MALNIVKNYATKFKRYGTKKTYTLDSIEIHTIGAAQNTVENIFNNMNQYDPAYGIVNAIVSADVENYIMEILPRDNVTWADGGYGNQHSFTVEICESDFMKYIPKSANYTVLNTAKFLADVSRGYINAVKYVAVKCKEFGFNPMDKLPNGLYRVYSHEEANKKGLATAHADPMHLWTKIGKTMDDFRKDVKKNMDDSEVNIKGIRIDDSNVEAISKIVYGEAGIIKTYDALLAVAQCIKDMLESGQFGKTVTQVMENNFSAYGSKETTDDARQAVYDVFINSKKRFDNAKIYQFRSFKKYSDGNGNIDLIKCSSLLQKYEYLGKDARNNEWGHFYFGKLIEAPKDPIKPSTTYKVQVGSFSNKKNAENQVEALKKHNINSFIFEEDKQYKVQAGSYSLKQNAMNRVGKIENLGFKAIIKEY